VLGLGEEHPETLDPESSRNANNGVRKNTGEGENSMKIEDETLTQDPQIPRNLRDRKEAKGMGGGPTCGLPRH
jgi:hypothetical protein